MFSRARVDHLAKEAGPEGRRFGRLKQKLLLCNWGQILDLSADGMRVRMRKKPPAVGEKIEIELNGFKVPGPIFARVVWARRNSMFNHEMGLELIEPAPATKRFLANIACADMRHMPFLDTHQADAA